jgi:hypothetical protein
MVVEDKLFDVLGLAQVHLDLFFLVVLVVVAVVHVALHDHFLMVEMLQFFKELVWGKGDVGREPKFENWGFEK